jgi:hypothetical protein
VHVLVHLHETASGLDAARLRADQVVLAGSHRNAPARNAPELTGDIDAVEHREAPAATVIANKFASYSDGTSSV